MRRLTLPMIVLAALLAACTQKNTADQQDQSGAAAADVALGVNRFLLFPNPIGTDPFAQDGGTFETNTTAYAIAYYGAIDPTNAKDTIDKWRAANGFTGYAVPARPGTEHLAVFRDVKDLGYGRRMTGRRNSDDGSVVFYVENYNVNPNGSAGYSSELNVDAAIRRDTQWHVGTNAIEWTSTPCRPNYDPADCDSTGTLKFAKYYNFSSADGTRQLAVDLDGRGKKAMPGPCITCHGGRGDPLTPPDQSGNPRFPVVENLPSRKRGDVGAHLHGQNVDSFTYSTTQPGFAKSDMQPLLKDFNQWILCTYPTPTPASVTGSWGTCNRPIAGLNEWQGTAAEMIQSWYGGPSMTGSFSDTYVPAGWSSGATIAGTTPPITDTALYQSVVAPYCRTCHILRGTNNQDDIDFFTLAKFQGFADRIKVLVFDRGNMPNSQIPHQDFWASNAPRTLANFVDAQLGAGTVTSSSGAPLMPGRPIADPGPDRMVRTGANAVLSGENSLFASSFSWTSISGPSNPVITNATGMVAIFNASIAGTYVVKLSINGGASSKNVTITVDDNFPDPLNIKFAQVKNVLQNVVHNTPTGTAKCVDCHKTAVVPLPLTTPPVWYTTFDRNGDSATDSTDEDWFAKALSGRVNFTEIAASPLLRKPSGHHHGGLQVIDVTDTSSGGGLRNYSILYNWVLAGTQPGGAAANVALTTPQTLTFGGSPLFSTPVGVDGTTSINATNFFWSVVSPPGSSALFANPAAASTTLSVPTTGTYVVQLDVDDGVTSDTVRRTLIVNEAAIIASFSPAGNVFVTFPPATNTGNVSLTSTSTYGGIGVPVSCRWVVTSVPVGVTGTTLDGQTTLDVTKFCSTPAILKVPLAAAGKSYGVQLTASTIGSNTTAVQTLNISNSAPTASLANTTLTQFPQFNTATHVNIPTHLQSSYGGAVEAAVQFSLPVVQANVSLNGSASTTPLGTLSYSWCLTSQPDSTNYPSPNVAICPAQTSSGTTSTLTMQARATGQYGVQLTVDNGSGTNSTSTTVTVRGPNNVAFRPTIVNIFTNSPCTGCHTTSTPLTNTFNPASNTSNFAAIPPWSDAPTLGGSGQTENVSLYQRIMQRVNLGLLPLCPHSGCDSGVMPGNQTGFVNTTDTNYVNVQNWVNDGAPPGN